MKKTIQEHKAESTLNKVFRYPEGIMSRREWLNLMRVRGCTVEEKTRRNYAAEEKLQQWLYDNRGDNSGNINWPPTKRYHEKKSELAAGIFKVEYRLNLPDGCFQDITKTEFEYFRNMELAEDITTQKNELNQRIEEDTLPLWKRLDEKRTKGEWNAENNDEGKNSVIYTTNIVEGLCNFYSSDRATYNAQYTALAVNNFASIVEALEGLCKHIVMNTDTFPPELLKAKEALSKIS